MELLLKTFRAAYLYAHRAHHRTAGCTFLSDHDFFGELYRAYEESFDTLMERCLGLGIPVNDKEVITGACGAYVVLLNDADSTAFLKRLLVTEKELQAKIEEESKNVSFGTQNLLQDLADQSEDRQYKLQQRLA